MTEKEHQPIFVHTIPGPLPAVPDYLIRRRPEEANTLEHNTFREAVINGDAGLVGMDGSGNEWDFPQQLGSTVVDQLVINSGEEL